MPETPINTYLTRAEVDAAAPEQLRLLIGTSASVAEVGAADAGQHSGHEEIENLIRCAREAGRTWLQIGDTLGLFWFAVAAKESIADIAYDYALEHRSAHGARNFTWTCPACQQLITDRGPFRQRPLQEEGHSGNCHRWAADLAFWREHNRDGVL